MAKVTKNTANPPVGLKRECKADIYFQISLQINKNKINDGSSHIVSTGLGFRSQNFFIDLAYVLKMTKEQYWLYSPNFVNEANNEYLFHRIVLTGGLKF